MTDKQTRTRGQETAQDVAALLRADRREERLRGTEDGDEPATEHGGAAAAG